jgi:hypothetical protein
MGGQRNSIGLLAGGLLFFFPSLSSAELPAVTETVVSIYPVTTGIAHPTATPITRVLILGSQQNSSMVVAIVSAKEVFRRGGIAIVDASSPTLSKENPGLQLLDRQDSDRRLCAIGKEAGADHVVVLEMTDTLVLEKEERLKNSYLHDERVSVRGIGVESGSVVFEGTAHWSQPVERAGEHVRELTTYAIARALCSAEKWEEATAGNNGRGRCRR